MEIPSSEEIEKEILRRKLESSLIDYVVWYFKYIKREVFFVHWFHESICNVLMDIYNGKKKYVIITMPPRFGKTELVIKAFMSWALARNQKCKFIHLSYSDDLALDNSSAIKEIVTSDEYQELWAMPLKHDSHAKKKWFNLMGGGVYATSTGGQITGMGSGSIDGSVFAGCIAIDDALKPDDARSDVIRTRMNDRFNNTIKSRRNSKDTPIILVQQRLHENDMPGFLLDGGSEFDFFHLNLPALNEDGPNKYDPRQKGEALWPDKHSIEDLEKMRIADAMTFAGQYQQRPAPAEGNIFRWFQFYTELPNNIHQKTHSWDFTFKKSDHSDFVVGQNWGATRNGDHYLIDLVRAKMSFSESLLSIKLFCKKHDDYRAVLIEAKANGEAIIDSIKNEVKNVIAINPTESKEARAEAVAPMFQSNRVFLPHPSIAPWINDFINEHKTFPNGKHDDQVDAATQYLNYVRENKIGSFGGMSKNNSSRSFKNAEKRLDFRS